MEKMKSRWMKTFLLPALIFVTAIPNLTAQVNEKKVIYIERASTTDLLVEKWIHEYTTVNPQVEIKIADRNTDKSEINLQIITHTPPDSLLSPGQSLLCVGRYALVPITCKCNPALDDIGELNKKKLVNLFFEKDVDETTKKSKDKLDVTVYSGNRANSGATTFSDHFGYSPSRLKGQRIFGDDIHLIDAIRHDTTGVTFNCLSCAYDIDSRKLHEDLALLPLDLKKDYKENYCADMDQLLTMLENNQVDLIPVDNVNVTYYNDSNKEVIDFLKWILSDGVKHNKKFGFLAPDNKTQMAQKIQTKIK